MQDLRIKLKRQVEILGIILSQNFSDIIRTTDLASIFKVEDLTIMRDLQQLRSCGIGIHSTKNHGICLDKQIDKDVLKGLIHQYSLLCFSNEFVEKSTTLLVKRLGEKSLANLVTIQMCIENKNTVLIDYEKENGTVEFGREVNPLLIFQKENYWRVLALSGKLVKQFHLNKIIEARASDKTYMLPDNLIIQDLFKNSWKSWIGKDEYEVKMKFSKKWAERIMPKQLMDHDVFTKQKDGSVMYETKVNSLEEMASWIASRGAGIIVYEPEELKQKVLDLANGVLSNYR
ncbi:MAG: WYL domain-containing protein [Ignavibacteria bacterium]|nr:WYL domain-containing protein [Ignavibacteria bacterium]